MLEQGVGEIVQPLEIARDDLLGAGVALVDDPPDLGVDQRAVASEMFWLWVIEWPRNTSCWFSP